MNQYIVECKDCGHKEPVNDPRKVNKDGTFEGQGVSSCLSCGSLNVTYTPRHEATL